MALPATTQDLIKGIDFTAINPQTASEHNQLIELSGPYTDGADDAQGIGFIISTTDTALNTPAVPNPTVSGYAKWKRYIWNRRPFGNPNPLIPQLYIWIDAATSDVTYLKWILLDPASYTSVGGGLGTPLQTAIDTINTNAANALAASVTATNSVATLTTKVGAVGATDLQTQVTSVVNAETTDAANITAITVSIGGSTGGVPNGLAGTGGINGQIAALQESVTTGLSAARNVNLITPSAIVGSMIRTNANASSSEWFNPASTVTDLILAQATGTITFAASATTALTLTGTLVVPAGVYTIHAVLGGSQTRASGNTILSSTFNVIVGVQSFPSIIGAQSTGSGGGFPCHMTVLGIVTVTQALAGAGGVALTASITNPALITFLTNGLFCQILLRKVALSV